MTETYTSGVLKVEPGREDDFAAAWTEFVEWVSEQPGSGTFRLVRDVEHSSRFMSFAPWESFGAQRASREADEFAARLGRVRDPRREPRAFDVRACGRGGIGPARAAYQVRPLIFDSA